MDCTPLTEYAVNKTDVSILSNWLLRNVNSVITGYVAPKSTTLDLRSMLLGKSKMRRRRIGCDYCDNSTLFEMQDRRRQCKKK